MEILELLSQTHDMKPGSAAPYLEGFAAHMASVGHTPLTISFYYYCVIKKQSDVRLFCGIKAFCARPTATTFRGVYGGPGECRGTQ